MHRQLGVLNKACLDLVSASDNPQQARDGCRMVIRILDKHSHFTADALEACRRCQLHDIIGFTVQLLIVHHQINVEASSLLFAESTLDQ